MMRILHAAGPASADELVALHYEQTHVRPLARVAKAANLTHAGLTHAV
jgi:hypothetical protein